jgi:hypothetical protein
MFDRVTAEMVRNRGESDASVIAKHIKATRLTVVNERELYRQPGWAWLRDGERRDMAFRALCDANWVKIADHSAAGRRRGDWLVSPLISEKYNHG